MTTADGPGRRQYDIYLHETRKDRRIVVGDATTNLRLVRARRIRAAEVPAAAGFQDGPTVIGGLRGGGGPTAALAVVTAALRHVAAAPEDALLVLGHGPDEALSAARARSLLAVLRGDEAAWVAEAAARGTARELQAILAWAAAAFGWPCDPGPADGVVGPATRQALHRLRKAYNEAHGATLPLNAPLGPDDWRALFRCYQADLERRLAEDAAGLRARQAAVRLHGEGAHGCGPAWSLARVRLEGLPATADERVDVLAFAPDDPPKLACHAEGPCAPKVCDVYRKGKYRAAPLAAPPDAGPRVRVRLVLRNVNDAPIAGRACELEVAGARTALTTAADGELVFEVPADARDASLRLLDPEAPATVIVPLRLHALAPPDGLRGQQERLRNLGYYLGDLEGEDQLDEDAPDAWRSAVEEFQCDQGLPVSGMCDAATRARLVEVHGG
ncbi:MAG: peptidoglycan-binding protein [Planctomycetes bacterium]|nr:peptidoglycan-binding protein [Planctomycetota bacterium]